VDAIPGDKFGRFDRVPLSWTSKVGWKIQNETGAVCHELNGRLKFCIRNQVDGRELANCRESKPFLVAGVP